MRFITKNVRRLTRLLLQPALDAQRERTLAEVRALLDAQWGRIPSDPWLRDRVDKGTQTLLQLDYLDRPHLGDP